MKAPDLTITITLTVPTTTRFMSVAQAIQRLANTLLPGAPITHDGAGFAIDARPRPASQQEAA